MSVLESNAVIHPCQQTKKSGCSKSGLLQKLLSSLENQTELMIDFTSLKTCLNPMGIEETQEGEDASEDKQFDYDAFVCDVLEKQPQVLPNLEKLSVRRILDLQYPTALTLDQHDHYARLNYGIMQLSSLSELDLSHVPQFFHDYVQLWSLCNLAKLSITDSKLTTFPSSVGSLRQLKNLNLSNNQLKTLPITLSFCQNLETLDLRNNAFTLLPSVLLNMKKLTTLKRLGNPLAPRYRWNGPKFIQEIKPSSEAQKSKKYQPLTLQESCTKEVYTMKIDYWETESIGVLQCRTLDQLAEKFYACDNCSRMLANDQGSFKFEVNVMLVTFKELSGVPFLLRACSERCQDLLAESYGNKNIERQHELDIKYENDIKKAQEDLREGHMEELPSRSYTYTPSQLYYRRKKRCSIM